MHLITAPSRAGTDCGIQHQQQLWKRHLADFHRTASELIRINSRALVTATDNLLAKCERRRRFSQLRQTSPHRMPDAAFWKWVGRPQVKGDVDTAPSLSSVISCIMHIILSPKNATRADSRSLIRLHEQRNQRAVVFRRDATLLQRQ